MYPTAQSCTSFHCLVPFLDIWTILTQTKLCLLVSTCLFSMLCSFLTDKLESRWHVLYFKIEVVHTCFQQVLPPVNKLTTCGLHHLVVSEVSTELQVKLSALSTAPNLMYISIQASLIRLCDEAQGFKQFKDVKPNCYLELRSARGFCGADQAIFLQGDFELSNKLCEGGVSALQRYEGFNNAKFRQGVCPLYPSTCSLNETLISDPLNTQACSNGSLFHQYQKHLSSLWGVLNQKTSVKTNAGVDPLLCLKCLVFRPTR